MVQGRQLKGLGSRSSFQKLLVRVGTGCLLLLLVFVIGLYGLSRYGFTNVWLFPLRRIAVFLVSGGLACLLAGWLSSRSLRKRLVTVALVTLIGVNAIAYVGAYTLTHFKPSGQFGFALPRPVNSRLPTELGLDYSTQRIPINQSEWLESWFIPTPRGRSQGTVLLFPGNGGSKGRQLLAPAKVLNALGYDSLLVDFRGVGGSSGNTTTIGVREAKDVASAVRFAEQSNLKHPIVLYGVSMGSAAILRAIAHEKVEPDAIILELPFARLLDAVRSRLRARSVPTFPISELIVLWGSIQHSFNGFAHNPVNDASQVRCPTLIFQGQRDQWTGMAEIHELLQNLQGFKQLVVFPTARHQLLVTVDQSRWQQSVGHFLEKVHAR
jgi:uncharacterized protein